MARVPDIALEEMTAEQRRVYQEIGGARGGIVRGPFALWLRNPEIADPANRFGNALRLSGKLDKRLFELMVLVVARHWSAQYEWFVHEKSGLEAGLTQAVVDAIRARRAPAFAREDERLVYDTITELNETRTLSQPAYDRALAALGLDLLIELIAAAGFYTMVAMTLNAFDAPVPGGKRPLP
ncbi:MAG: carboxymuconolactone decarboxylase family protein [Deltaproteobacteria bacterium]|nr:carboxymuconolactone decarboxylase family protein [Deltaproteobacteria bacterium]MDZ4346167.1 carboxymuconolactone decarboxylase family protein [Candidatus Binatia bacterium]